MRKFDEYILPAIFFPRIGVVEELYDYYHLLIIFGIWVDLVKVAEGTTRNV